MGGSKPICYHRSLTAARTTVDRSPALDESSERLGDRSFVPTNGHPRVTNDTWNHDRTIGQAQILLGEPGEQFLVQPDQRISSVKGLQSGRGAGVLVCLHCLVYRSFAGLLGVNVGHGKSLLAREVGIRREVVLQRSINVARTRVLAFDSVRVVAVHRTQQDAQLALRGSCCRCTK